MCCKGRLAAPCSLHTARGSPAARWPLRALPRSLQTVSQAPSGPRPDVLKLANWERLLGALRTVRTASTLGPQWPGRNLCRSLPVVGPSQWGRSRTQEKWDSEVPWVTGLTPPAQSRPCLASTLTSRRQQGDNRRGCVRPQGCTSAVAQGGGASLGPRGAGFPPWLCDVAARGPRPQADF